MWLLTLFLAGCPAESPSPAPAPAVADAADALCAEHGVLSSVCAQCNPRLAPVFQASGDWCEEHGLAESFCPFCHPERGGRPAQAVEGGDGSPPDGIVVQLERADIARQAGLQTQPAEETDWLDGPAAAVQLTWDATRTALVSPRVPGVVTRVHADVGSTVRQGEVLAELRSAHAGGDRARLSGAREHLRVAELEHERQQRLYEAGVVSARTLQQAEADLAGARAELGALRAEVGVAGGGSGDALHLASPIDGVVVDRRVAVGQQLSAEAPAYFVVDPSVLWAELDLPEDELHRVAVGQPVQIHLDALPDETFAGSLEVISPAVDPHTRTARARVSLPNREGRLRAHLYGTATVVTDAQRAVTTVPSAAVQRAGEVHLVFVRESDTRFVGRRVQVLARQGDRVRIAGAVQPGDDVVTTGSFLLKTETVADSIGAGCCDVE